MSCKLITSGKLLGAKVTSKWLLSSMDTHVSSLVLQSVERLVADITGVRAGCVVSHWLRVNRLGSWGGGHYVSKGTGEGESRVCGSVYVSFLSSVVGWTTSSKDQEQT